MVSRHFSDTPEDVLIAHWRKDDQCGQLLEEHLQETSRLAGIFASKIDLAEIGTIEGLVHDFGKEIGRASCRERV